MASLVFRKPGSCSLSRDFSDLFDGLFSLPTSSPVGPVPPMDLWEDEDSYYVELETPAYRMEDLEISVTGNELNIVGRVEDPAKGGDSKELHYYRRERAKRSSFARTVELPGELQLDGVEAALRDGLLRVTLPKAQEAKPKKVEIRLS